jgi:hypothetical protein
MKKKLLNTVFISKSCSFFFLIDTIDGVGAFFEYCVE